ncbi:MAG TPA: nucleotidyl transferase AbiEii/AbiGii toxin family protein, partial [Spirochaetota bacterium]|nr:nucleotidyl transferase AbiEii/AbiGii toxin family protein [Spirochaetota bacterium]
MAKPVDYKELYRVQDKILDIIFSEESIFYLTGGTCINRFYSEKRYSDDLDFFTSDNNLFRDNIRMMYNIFGENKISIEQVADSKDFVRIIVDEILKVDFVNDRTFYYGKTLQSEKGYILDNAMNMLANKLSAV